MNWRNRKLQIFTVILLAFFLLQSTITHVRSQTLTNRVRIYSGVILKPNSQHQYVLSTLMDFHNVTLNSGTLGLSKSSHAYNIKSTTSDNINITLYEWFFGETYRTTFRPIAQSETSLSFTVNTRDKGEPQKVDGATSWSYNEDSTTLTLICASGSTVMIDFLSESGVMIEWWLGNIPMWMGLFGMVLSVLSPAMVVKSIKSGEWHSGMIWALIVLPIGICFMIAWLWG